MNKFRTRWSQMGYFVLEGLKPGKPEGHFSSWLLMGEFPTLQDAEAAKKIAKKEAAR